MNRTTGRLANTYHIKLDDHAVLVGGLERGGAVVLQVQAVEKQVVVVAHLLQLKLLAAARRSVS